MEKSAEHALAEHERRWLSPLQCAHEKGQRLGAYAQENGLCKDTLYRWHSKMRKRGLIGHRETPDVQSLFVPVRIESSAAPSPWRVVFPSGVCLEVAVPQIPAQCAMLLQALRTLT